MRRSNVTRRSFVIATVLGTVLALLVTTLAAPVAVAQTSDDKKPKIADGKRFRTERLSTLTKAERRDVRAGLAAGTNVYLSTSTALYLMDTTSGALTYVGPYDHTGMFDIALMPDGSMYGVAGNGSWFVEINPSDASTRYIDNTGWTINGLTATPGGVMYGSGFDRIYSIDVASGKASPVMRTGGLQSAGDLAGGPPRTLFFASDVLAKVNLNTSTATAIGTQEIDCLYGLADTAAGLFGATCDGRVLRINRTTGEVVGLVDDGGPSWYGMAALPWDGSEESKLTCTPGAANATNRIKWGTRVDCTFKPGTGEKFRKWVHPSFVGASTRSGARFTARQGGRASISAVYLDASGTEQRRTIDYAIKVIRPTMALPFRATTKASRWKYSGGPHCDWSIGTGVCKPGNTPTAGHVRYAIDLVPPKQSESACAASKKPARAVAAGTVKIGKDNGKFTVQINHGGGFGTGYYHLKNILVKKGDRVVKGQALGYPGCAGTDTTHLHFYVCHQPMSGGCKPWSKEATSIPIKGTVLGGWRIGELPGNYDGTLKMGTRVLTAKAVGGPKIPLK